MRIKINDKVQVMSGKDKGKTGKVLQILPDSNQVVVEGINTMYKHLRSRQKGEKGQRVQFNGPVAISNLQVVCPKCNKVSRLGTKMAEASESAKKKTKARFCKKCQEVID
ncbi:50S ribosomal protein L24 [Candidatus Parcubacteria bacterium]|nr:MAG: 50S ribosomal protein L24 [Candidatus Parcubacteria bacterium]